MKFLLMRPIVMLAFALVASTAMAVDDFDATFSVDGNSRNTAIAVTLTFGEPVGLMAVQAVTITITVIYEDFTATTIELTGDVAAVANKDIDASTADTQTDGKTFIFTIPEAVNTATAKTIHLSIPKGVPSINPTDDKSSKAGTLTIDLVGRITPDRSHPKVVSIQRLGPISQAAVSAFQEAEVTGAFDVRIVLTERPDGGLTLDLINVEGGTASNLVVGVPFARVGEGLTTLVPHPLEGDYDHSLTGVPGATESGTDLVPSPTGTDGMYHQYRATITPYYGAGMVKISINEFHDGGLPFRNVYTPMNVVHKPNGREQLRLAIGAIAIPLETKPPLSLPKSEVAQTTIAETSTETIADVTTTATVETEVPDTSVMIPMAGKIYISEIMFDRDVHGTLPQWIEISNGSRTEQVNLSGWTLTVENATADTDVSVGAKAVFTIPQGTRIDPSGQHDTPSTVLVVTEQARNNLEGARAAGQVVNLWVDQQVELIRLDIFKRRYSLLSDIAFKITLAPPTPAEAMDVVGNLVSEDGTAAWVLPVNEEGTRSSIIRRHVSAEPKDGELMDSWMLASETGLAESVDTGVRRYYGLPTDVGTPGFRAGGALPVELSHFRPERNKETGQVMITWATESELNNAGFFISRSQQADGEFEVVTPTMIPGAGTTHEKRLYTYTDTTAQLNVVYYYQIEDVSFDGARRTLVRGVRLRGHVGAAGKATVIWGELKTSNQ